MPDPNCALGDVYYGNDLNPLAGRYQATHLTALSAATDVTAGTPGTTNILWGPQMLQSAQLLDLLVYYPAASGAVTTPFAATLYKFVANSGTHVAIGPVGALSLTEANMPIRTVRRFSLAVFTSATFQVAQIGAGAYAYPVLSPGDCLELNFTTLGIGGTQTAIQFQFIYRELPQYPTGPTMTTAGTDTTFGAGS